MSDKQITNAPQTIQEDKPKADLWNQSFFARSWVSYLLIAGSSAVGLIFVFVAQLDSNKAATPATVRKQLQKPHLLQSNHEASQIPAGEEATLDRHKTAAVPEYSSFIQQAMHEENSHTQQPDRVELTAGGDISGDSPVRLLGVIEFTEDATDAASQTDEQPNVSLEVVPLPNSASETANPFEQINNQ